MTSVFVVERQSKKGKRFHVRMEYGRSTPQVHLGVFPTKTLADARVRSALKELAQGVAPTKHPVADRASTSVDRLAGEWFDTRIDVAENTRRHYRSSIAAIRAEVGKHDASTLAVADLQSWVRRQNEEGISPGTIRLRLTCLAMILDYGEIEPNPVRSRKLKKPKARSGNYRLPTNSDLDAIYANLPAKAVGAVKLMEHGGLRVSEACAVRWGDWDRPRRRLLVPDAKTKAGIRWIDQVDGLPEMPDRLEGVADDARISPGLTAKMVQHAIRNACAAADIRTFSPHDLRHLHASRLLHTGKLSPALIAARLGHASPDITLGTYSHVVLPD